MSPSLLFTDRWTEMSHDSNQTAAEAGKCRDARGFGVSSNCLCHGDFTEKQEFPLKYSKLRPTYTRENLLQPLSCLLNSEKLVSIVSHSLFNTPSLGLISSEYKLQGFQEPLPKLFPTVQVNPSNNQCWNDFFLNALSYIFLNDSLHFFIYCLVRMTLMHPCRADILSLKDCGKHLVWAL